MANTTNFNWETPDDTDLVKDGAAAIRTLAGAIDTSLVDLKGGTTGQVLSKATGTDMDFTWVTSDDANAIQNAIVDAKGDIVAASANDTPARLAVGTDNHRLIAASGETTGLKYVADTQNTVIDAEGDLLVGDSADTLQRLAIGSNTHVLTVDTAVDGKIKWAAPASGGGMTLLSTTTLSGATTSIGSISQSYTNLYVVVKKMTNASTAYNLNIRCNGSTTLTTYTGFEKNSTSNGTFYNGTSQNVDLEPTFANGYSQTDANNILAMDIFNYSATDSYKVINLTNHFINSAGNQSTSFYIAGFRSDTEITSIDFNVDGGTFNGGTVLIYGVK
jgi:hypothetical protein